MKSRINKLPILRSVASERTTKAIEAFGKMTSGLSLAMAESRQFKISPVYMPARVSLLRTRIGVPKVPLEKVILGRL